ncbi:MAG: AAA domain-containing protein [Bryobacterales bacterium]|nr:AAA domain-containing protein [Bryobacteraceae bacterium]MDW8355619.1 AAA domain-containing protein [Bryobacterales bacterium]
MSIWLEKSQALLRFLRDVAALRRKPITAYRAEDKLLWLSELPRDLPPNRKQKCKSVFYSDNPEEVADLWLEIQKERQPRAPAVPSELRDWVPQQFQDHPERYLDVDLEELFDLLNQEIHVPVEKPSPWGDPSRKPRTVKLRRIDEQPHLRTLWDNYLRSDWEPWRQQYRQWKALNDIYERIDFMRRRLEEAEERYELILGLGLLVWRNPENTIIRRHVLTTRAEISLDAARGILRVAPATSFDGFHIELDMLELERRPRIDNEKLNPLLEELDIHAWDRKTVARILRIVANRMEPIAEVLEDTWDSPERAEQTPRIFYAPALVLRERQLNAYDVLIESLIDSTTKPNFAATPPWTRLLYEGQTPTGSDAMAAQNYGRGALQPGRLYFPLPTNDEQRNILTSLQARPYVLVKGPPGTGKSHTIANLICHLLADGENVLVTAQAPKALAVLRDLLPEEIRSLCVPSLGGSREEQRLLQESVNGILERSRAWTAEQHREQTERLERELQQFERQLWEVEAQLRQCREAETQTITLPGGYQGTAGKLAQELEAHRNRYDWFPELPSPNCECPLQPEEIQLLARVHTALTPETLAEISQCLGTFPLPDPEEFSQILEKLEQEEQVAEALRRGVDSDELERLCQFSDVDLESCKQFLDHLERQAARAARLLGDCTDDILKDLLVGEPDRWQRVAQEAKDIARRLRAAQGTLADAQVQIPPDADHTKLLEDASRRLEHFRYGGRRGWGPFAPGVVRETRYVEEWTRVRGSPPRDLESLELLVSFLEFEHLRLRFSKLWPRGVISSSSERGLVVGEIEDQVACLHDLLSLFRDHTGSALQVVPISQRIGLAEETGRGRWRRLIEAELARRRVQAAQQRLDELLGRLRQPDAGVAHPCLGQLAHAIERRDRALWSEAWARRKQLMEKQQQVQLYRSIVQRLEPLCPNLAALIERTQGQREWSDRLRELGPAWRWRQARQCLREFANPQNYESLAARRQQLQLRIENVLAKLVAQKAWGTFLQRLDDRTRQNLVAWQKAMARIGKGTGKYAYSHRRTAQQRLAECVAKIPAWIMPLHKVWETTKPIAGLFDTVIIDEASQAGVEALVLFLLAKRIIVVGDDKQNSPEAVGVHEDDIARLAREHLQQFHFREEYRPDSSLYDHAERAFGTPVFLREHFRCVPEIIRFSNELCYREAPLIPLRQPPPNRLPPLLRKFVPNGHCEGEGQRLLNKPEAEAIVTLIRECIDTSEYANKTMGVIALQGHAQAEYIEARLAECLEPKVREERKLRCGVPATFQGDERDVIFLSLVIAPDYSYRALTELEAERRFNVAMSRARDQVVLFHSVQLHELGQNDLRRRLLQFFENASRFELENIYEHLDRLERAAKSVRRMPGSQPEPYDSWFEVDVALELLRRKYRIRPQVEVAGYRIDLVVEGLANRLAVECDGDAWHGPEQFAKDMDRQRQLERVGWKFVRIRESEFYVNRTGAIKRIIEACNDLRIEPVGEEKTDPGGETGKRSADGLERG